MVLVIRKRQLVFLALFLLFFSGMAAVLWQGRGAAAPVFAPGLPESPVIVIDAGHGGEDGGAVAADGTPESGINLGIALRLNDLLRLCGQKTRMIRTEDVSVYTPGAETLRAKKVSDLKNRVALVNGTEGAILLSVHQNCLPSSPAVHGAQAFYNSQAGADALAGSVQDALNESVNDGNGKSVRKIQPTIYLMKNVTAPAVLVECGFLSNPRETAALKTADYQQKMAVAIAAGFLRGGGGGEETQ